MSMSECNYGKCYKKFSPSELKSLKYIHCSNCNLVKYCSESCMNLDR